MIQMGFSVVRRDRLCFGTDYPFETHFGRDYRYYLDNVASLDVAEADKQAFLGGNMAQLLKVDAGPAANA
jgi:predicted TIM-barrel fold metal-dependent hydrolase